MDVYILLDSHRSADADLSALAALLPPRVIAACDYLDPDPAPPETALPRIVAHADLAGEAEAEAVARAVTRHGAADLTVGFAPPEPVIPEPVAAPPPPEFFGVSEAALEAAVQAAAGIEAVLARVMAAERTGTPFPEQGYAGADAAAYARLCGRLGVEPMADRGRRLVPGDVERAAAERPADIDPAAWRQVACHLAREVRVFHAARAWFGTPGHVNAMLTSQRFLDDDFVARLNRDYLQMPTTTQVSVELDVCMGLAAKAAAALPGPGKLFGALLAAVWTGTKAQMGGRPTRIAGQIAALSDQVAETFQISLVAQNAANGAILSDWGLLDAFGRLLDDETLSWPDDLTPLYAAKSRGFQYEALRTMLRLTNSSGLNHRTTVGVVVNRPQVKGKQHGAWHGHRYRTHSEYYKGKCGIGKGYYCLEYYVGYETVTRTGGAQTPPSYVYSEVSRALGDKLFGTNRGDVHDPQFGLTQGFMMQAASRRAWGLALFRTY